MILSRKWLNEFVDCSAWADHDFSEAMTLSGSKVETFTDLHKNIQNVVAGRIVEMVRHTNSDHMWVCQVDVGGDAPLQIVTGAQNQKVGDMVPVALDGSLLPDGKEIHAGMLRGELSNGMMCSLKELGLTLHDYPYAIEDGLWVMQEDGVKPGDDIAAVIGMDDHVVEFEITPNRPDCLSVIGLAREAAVTFDKPLKLHTPEVPGSGEDIHDHVSIRIDDPALCPRYTARMVRNVKIAPSPAWMRERLRNSGVRPINNIVDITNYVMLEYGQPMHAFDFSCIGGKQIIVRTAREGETIQTLDGNARKLTPNMLCICDEEKPVAVAGVMGGANSEIVGDTAMVVFEGANFNGTSIRRTAAALGMRTEASGRFEKGLDPMNTVAAVDRACELVELLGCGEVMRGTIDVLPEPIVPKTVKLEPDKVNGLLGTDVSEAEMRRILLALGFALDGDTIIVPSWRGDVEHYSDIAEEIARFYGYNNIPCTLMRGQTTSGGYTDAQKAERSIGAMARALTPDAGHPVHGCIENAHADVRHADLINIRETKSEAQVHLRLVLDDLAVFAAGIARGFLHARQDAFQSLIHTTLLHMIVGVFYIMFSPLASHSRLQKRQPRAKHAQRKPHAARKQHHAEPHECDRQHQAQRVQLPLRRALPRQRRDRRMQRAAAVERQHRQQIHARVQQAQVCPLRVPKSAQNAKQSRTGGRPGQRRRDRARCALRLRAAQRQPAALHAQAVDLRTAQHQRRDMAQLMHRHGERQPRAPAQRQQKIQPGEQRDRARANIERKAAALHTAAR